MHAVVPLLDSSINRRTTIPKRLSAVRKFLLWWFGPPDSPWVSVNLTVDFTAANQFLERKNKDREVTITVQHFLMGCIAGALSDVPEANSRIVNGRIYPQDQIGIAYPVNLLGYSGEADRELSMGLVANAEQLSLEQIAKTCTRSTATEREGKVENGLLRFLLKTTERLPSPVLNKTLDRLDVLMRRPAVSERIHQLFPATTALTNPGAAFSSSEGLLFRGGGINLPHRFIYVGTLWGISTIQQEVIPIDGKPAVRPMLPVMLLFDHRLIDGVKAGQLGLSFANRVRKPDEYF